jgi:hypothetical protein
MNENEMKRQLKVFDDAIHSAKGPHECWQALQMLAGTTAGFKLFTVMTVDMAKDVARRVHTSHPAEYPVTGTKPIHRDAWFDVVHGQQKSFVANTIFEIAQVFPDHEKIWSMGCGSVVNLPVVVGGVLVATINMLHGEHFYTPEKVAAIEKYLAGPAKIAYLAAKR